jgi:hypothetical protein
LSDLSYVQRRKLPNREIDRGDLFKLGLLSTK